MDVVIKHLKAARAELVLQRLRVERDIDVIDRLIETRYAGEDADDADASADDEAHSPPEQPARRATGVTTVRDAIVWVLESEPRDWHLNEIVEAVGALGVDAKPASVRSVVSRVVRDGQAVKGTSGRSSYRAASRADEELFADVPVPDEQDPAGDHSYPPDEPVSPM